MSDTSIFDDAIFDDMVFDEIGGNCVVQIDTTLSSYISQVQSIQDTSFFSSFVFRERGTQFKKIITVKQGI